ncbi:glycosyltransferase [Rivularia sp. PCC 7116]|uniref:glycosyltransferase n=1 Tax=Rivularia sp. PCC 7116 TaxID=373994 RepID=UPI0018DECFF9|nr:glycosyltransferase [Rivularia sp. PCC 7116]
MHNLEKYHSANYNNPIDTTVDIIVIANREEINAATDLVNKYGDRLFTYSLSKSNKIINCLGNLSIPFKFSTRYKTVLAKQIKELLKQNTYDIIHFEYSHAAVYLDLIKNQINSENTRIIISIHDIISQSFLRKSQKKPILGIEVARLFNFEKNLYSKVNELWVLSTKDRNILTSLFNIPENKIIIKPPRLSNFIYQVERNTEKIEKKSLLFWAAMNRPENEQAAIKFIQNCFINLLEIDSKYKLYIVGSNPSVKIKKLASKNIIVTGFIENPTHFFENAQIGIVPLVQGAGIKLKTLEMLQAGLPVIATSIGAEGIETSKNLFVSDNFDDWVNIITNLTQAK